MIQCRLNLENIVPSERSQKTIPIHVQCPEQAHAQETESGLMAASAIGNGR